MKIIKALKNLVILFLKYPKLEVFTNLIIGDVSLPSNIYKFKGNKIAGKVKISEGVSLYNTFITGNVEIGKWTSINGPNTTIVSRNNEIKIGAFCSIARNVQVQAVNHSHNRASTYSVVKNYYKEYDPEEFIEKSDIIIEDDVWIGTNSVILPGVKLGRGSIVGAGSVITKDVERYSIVGGVPAKKIKMRFTEETIEELEASKWWQWNDEQMTKSKEFFKKFRN